MVDVPGAILSFGFRGFLVNHMLIARDTLITFPAQTDAADRVGGWTLTAVITGFRQFYFESHHDLLQLIEFNRHSKSAMTDIQAL
jgi:hypothetical protein